MRLGAVEIASREIVADRSSGFATVEACGGQGAGAGRQNHRRCSDADRLPLRPAHPDQRLCPQAGPAHCSYLPQPV